MNKKSAVSRYLSEIGGRGGAAKVPKGFSMMDEQKRTANAKKGAAARWGPKKAVPKKKAGKKGKK